MTMQVFVCDTESTTDTGRVYAVAFAPLEPKEDLVGVCENLEQFFEPFKYKYYGSVQMYFHNLKWDGQHIISYLLKSGFVYVPSEENLEHNTFTCCIAELGQFYSITICIKRNRIYIYDSLKILPFSLQKIGIDFDLPHRKTTMEYDKQSLAEFTEEDMTYLRNDVLVLKDAINVAHEYGLTKQTIGSCCMAEYKKLYRKQYKNFWCDLTEIALDEQVFGVTDADFYCRKAYKGGFCYLHRAGRFKGGMTFDVNSLYPSMMNSSRRFPVGTPHFWRGDVPSEAKSLNHVYIVRFKCRFDLKPKKLPCVQIKDSFYPTNEWLKTSSYYEEPVMFKLKPVEQYPTLTMTSVEFDLFLENYNVSDLVILDGCWFDTKSGKELYGKYIEKWKKIKQESKGAVRQVAKLMLNNLYGKLGTNRYASQKEPYLSEKGIVKYTLSPRPDKKTYYVPQACFITAYARKFTILSAQANINRLLYIDTDSIHMTGYEPPIGLTIHKSEFECWAHESTWSDGIFVRQKTYAECTENGWDIKACGLPERAKNLFLCKCGLCDPPINLHQAELDYLNDGKKCDISDLQNGFEIPVGKLQPMNTPEGVILKQVGFKVHIA